MKKIFKNTWTLIILSLFSLLPLNSCAVIENIKQTDKIAVNEAIIISRVHMNLPDLNVYIEEERPATFLTAHNFLISMGKITLPNKLYVVRVPATKVFYSGTYRGASYTTRPKYTSVNLTAGAINYIGDHYTNWDYSTGLVYNRIEDNEASTIALAKKEFPWLFKQLPYHKAVPVVIPVDTVKGYIQVDELK